MKLFFYLFLLFIPSMIFPFSKDKMPDNDSQETINPPLKKLSLEKIAPEFKHDPSFYTIQEMQLYNRAKAASKRFSISLEDLYRFCLLFEVEMGYSPITAYDFLDSIYINWVEEKNLDNFFRISIESGFLDKNPESVLDAFFSFVKVYNQMPSSKEKYKEYKKVFGELIHLLNPYLAYKEHISLPALWEIKYKTLKVPIDWDSLENATQARSNEL